MNPSPVTIAASSRGLKTLSVVTRLLLWLVLAAWSLFALTWGVLQLWIVPRIGDWRPDLERWATEVVGVPVKVGEIVAAPRTTNAGPLPSFMPAFELRDVRLYDAQGRVALQLPLVRTAVSVGSLWRLSFEQLVIERPVLDVRRTAEGRIQLAGLDFSGQDRGDGGAVEWFFDQPEWVIQRGEIRWTDELRQQPALVLQALDLVVRNTGRSHQIRLDATPPAEWGERFSLVARLREPLLRFARPSAAPGQPWQRWDGQLYADLPRVDVRRLRAYVDLSDWGVALRSGEGGVRAWAELARGRVTGLTTDLALTAVDLQLGPTLQPMLLDEVTGRVAAQWDDEGLGVSTDALRFRSREGTTWPGGRLNLKHTRAAPGRAPTTAFTANALDLTAISAIASRLPLSKASHATLASLRPAGRVRGLNLSWQGEPGVTPAGGALVDWQRGRYQLKGRIEGLALASLPRARSANQADAPLPGRPGVTGATVDFDLDQQGGRANVSIAQGSLDLPGIFPDSVVPLERLQADASWRLKGGRIEVQLDKVSLANADAQGTAQVRWQTSDPTTSASRSRFPGVLDLTATVSRVDATRVHRYLPLTVGPLAQRYVREAVGAGQLSQVGFRVQGDLWDMPFNLPGARGTFRIAAQLQDLDFAYVPPYLQAEGAAPWPALRGARGALVLDRTAMTVSSVESGLEGAPHLRLSQAQIDIDDLAQTTTLVVSARAQGPASEVLDFVRNSPVNAMTGQALARARIEGDAGVQFRLRLPLHHIAATTVSGTVALAGNDLQISPQAPLLARASGSLQFSEQGFSVSAAQAQLYGGPVRFDGGMQPAPGGGTPRVRFQGQGTASAEGLSQAGLGFVSRLFDQAQGSAAYSAELAFRGGVPELLVTSDLQGLAIALPAPLGKSAESSLALRYDNAVLTELDGLASSDRLRVQIGPTNLPLVDLQYERDLTSGEPRVLRGSVAVGLDAAESAPLPAAGVLANIRFPRLHVDDWQRAFQAVAGVPARTETAAASAAASPQLGYLPTTLAVRAEQLTVNGRSFNGVVLGGSREGTLWRANIDAFELSGYGELRPPEAGSAGSVFARLAHLQLAPSVAKQVEQLLQQPRSMPALDLAVDDLTLGERRLGRVEVQAVNRGGVGRASEWQLNRFSATMPEARLSATGTWAADPKATSPGAPRRTQLAFELDVADSGQLLERFGRAGVVRDGKGRIVGQLAWLGSPLSVDYASLSGQLKAEFERGQFLKVEPGAAKLLGVLSLQALPRRLALDFRDVFSDGFAFDFVRGDARVDQGVIFTNNLQMTGVNAAVLMEGSANIALETQDLKVVVVPEINAGTASLIATAINPVIGLGTFLAQFLLRQPLQSAATQQFQISGSWADPQVQKIDRNALAATPPAAGNAPPPASQ